MRSLTLEHFKRAAVDVGVHGDNDTLPFDPDNRFIADNVLALAELAFTYSQELGAIGKDSARKAISSLPVFAERLLAPTGPAGFRVTTKIHPFWNLYFNGLGIAIAEALEPQRSARAHSYRFASQGDGLFDRSANWRAFREATIVDCHGKDENTIVVQTDISSFYEHVSHHRVENCIADLFPGDSTLPAQVDRFLSRFAAGRSFGLPVGGQCARILAELLMSSIDGRLTDERLQWRRYVDDFVLITSSQSEAYRALSVLSHALADYGLTLNRSKTMLLSVKHYTDYVRTQLGSSDPEVAKLLEIDLRFDPYSDSPESDYDELKGIVESLNVRALLDLELHKGQPDTFAISQIGRTLKLHAPQAALKLCETLLAARNLHSFRASWSTIMRGVAAVRADTAFSSIFASLDELLDAVATHSPHLLQAEASCLHYLRALRFCRTQQRAEYVLALYGATASETIKRACTDCWRQWKDRPSFIRQRNLWTSLPTEEQRMLWLAAGTFGDEGAKFRQQVRPSLPRAWALGIERIDQPSFESLYTSWAAHGI